METPFWDNDERGYEGPLYSSNAWDVVELGGQKLPGVWTAQAVASKRVDEKQAAGSHAATPTFLGKKPAEVTLTGYIWTPAQLKLWNDIVELIWPPPCLLPMDAKKAKAFKRKLDNTALDIYHPALAMLRISSVIVEAIPSPAPGRNSGERTVVIKCREFVARSKKTASSAVKTVESSVGVVEEYQPQERNYTTADGKSVNVSPAGTANAPKAKPSTSRGFIGPSGV